MAREGLTEKEQLFVEAYIANRWNAAQAAIDAGFSEKSARTLASRLLSRVNVQAAISEAVKEKAKALGFDATKERIVQELCSIAFANPRDLFQVGPDGVTVRDWDDLPDNVIAAVAKVGERPTKEGKTITVELHSKTPALDMLAKILGVYAPEKVEANVSHSSEEGAGLLANTSREEQDILTRILSRSDRGVTN